jgi:hypothetical protein
LIIIYIVPEAPLNCPQAARMSLPLLARIIVVKCFLIEVDPLTCHQCRGVMRVISIIEDQEVINKILGHLGLW